MTTTSDSQVDVITNLVPLLVDATIKGAFVLVGGTLVVFAMRRASAATRHLAWLGLLSTLVVMPLLQLALPGWHVLPDWSERSTAKKVMPHAVQTTSQDASPLESAASRQSSDEVAISQGPQSLSEAQATLEQDVARVAASAAVRESGPNSSGLLWMIVTWLAGMILVLFLTAAGWFRLKRLERSCSADTEGALTRPFREASSRLHMARPVKLLIGDSGAMPMTWGVGCPRLLMPVEALDWPKERQRVVLLHELAHVKRHDSLSQIMTQIVCAVYWFNPLVWFARRGLVTEAERACDDVVLNVGCKASDYAEHVLNIAKSFHLKRLPGAPTTAMAHFSTMGHRIASILDTNRNRRGLTSTTVLIRAALLLALVSVMAMARGSDGKPIRNPVSLDSSGNFVVTHTLYITGAPESPVFRLENKTYQNIDEVVSRIGELMKKKPFPYIRVRTTAHHRRAQRVILLLGVRCRSIGFINMEIKYDLTEAARSDGLGSSAAE